MKRLCVFYKSAAKFVGKPIEWIVCKECQRKLQRGTVLETRLFDWQKIAQQLWDSIQKEKAK